MNTQRIQKKIAKHRQEIETLEKELKIQMAKETSSSSKWLAIPELGIEVEVEVHDKNKSWDTLGLKDREDELLTVEQCIFLANSKYASTLKMDGSSSSDDFFIKQPFNANRAKGYVAVFYSYWVRSGFSSGGAFLLCYVDPSIAGSYRGVRFVRKISKRSKK